MEKIRFNIVGYILLLVFSILPVQLFGQKYAVYIDPTWTGVEKGTISQPYSSLPENPKKNTKYLIKGGTVLEPRKTIDYDMDSVTLGSYDGVATIESALEGRLINLQGNSVRIENLKVIVLNNKAEEAHGTNGVNMVTRGGRGYIVNVSVNGGWRGIDAGGDTYDDVGVIYVTDVTINNTLHDGMYITHLDSLIVSGCKVMDVNLDWFDNYGGDGIQCGEIHHVIIKDCYVDHTSTPGKYCLISTNTEETNVDNCHFKSFNTEACLYPSSLDVSPYKPMLTVTNCIFEGGWRAIQHRTDNTKIQNCLFVGCSESEWAIDGNVYSEISNCTFVNYKRQLMGSFGSSGQIVTKNTKNLYYNCVSMLANKDNVEGSYNNFYPWSSTMDEALIMENPLYRDPMFKDTIYYEPTDPELVRLTVGWRYNNSGPTPPVKVSVPGTDVPLPTAEPTVSYLSVKANVYPNPCNGNFSIGLPGMEGKDLAIEVFDLLGRIVYKQTVSKPSETTVVSPGLTTGQYILKLSTDSKPIKTVKLIVN
jgi:hypothetical protein